MFNIIKVSLYALEMMGWIKEVLDIADINFKCFSITRNPCICTIVLKYIK